MTHNPKKHGEPGPEDQKRMIRYIAWGIMESLVRNRVTAHIAAAALMMAAAEAAAQAFAPESDPIIVSEFEKTLLGRRAQKETMQ